LFQAYIAVNQYKKSDPCKNKEEQSGEHPGQIPLQLIHANTSCLNKLSYYTSRGPFFSSDSLPGKVSRSAGRRKPAKAKGELILWPPLAIRVFCLSETAAGIRKHPHITRSRAALSAHERLSRGKKIVCLRAVTSPRQQLFGQKIFHAKTRTPTGRPYFYIKPLWEVERFFAPPPLTQQASIDFAGWICENFCPGRRAEKPQIRRRLG
jgi:hypothetical protein